MSTWIGSDSSHRFEIQHRLAIQQDEGFVSQTALPLLLFRPYCQAAIPHLFVSVEESSPVARLGCLGQVSLAECPHAVVCDALRRPRVAQQRLHLIRQIVEVAFHFDVVLIGTVGYEKVVVVLDVLKFVCNDDGVARLTVLERC